MLRVIQNLMVGQFARIQEDASATQIVKGVDVLVTIRSLQEAWKEVTNLTKKIVSRNAALKGTTN